MKIWSLDVFGVGGFRLYFVLGETVTWVFVVESILFAQYECARSIDWYKKVAKNSSGLWMRQFRYQIYLNTGIDCAFVV